MIADVHVFLSALRLILHHPRKRPRCGCASPCAYAGRVSGKAGLLIPWQRRQQALLVCRSVRRSTRPTNCWPCRCRKQHQQPKRPIRKPPPKTRRITWQGGWYIHPFRPALTRRQEFISSRKHHKQRAGRVVGSMAQNTDAIGRADTSRILMGRQATQNTGA